QEPGFIFSKIFHPLIKNSVSNDAVCSFLNHGIVISGPNTGGKTVFLKSVTISYLLFFHGFFVPAVDAEMYPYDGVFYFGRDQESAVPRQKPPHQGERLYFALWWFA
ncbi:MAG: hypothetical protein EBU92_13680, partial [Betaproteobacteria bacterium]|nr:hypothetical protein [Betaproteobacteria bacterium]